MVSQSKKVYVIGAGASHGARVPSPPLGNQLHHYVREYLSTAWGELGVLEEPEGSSESENMRTQLKQELENASSYEYLVGQLLKSNPNQLQKLNLLMAYALTPPLPPRTGEPIGDPKVDDAFIEKHDLYDKWLKKIHESDSLHNVSFISLNYDCLLECAICRSLGGELEPGSCLCKFVNYWLDEQGSGVEVLKPHGSINWVHDLNNDGGILETGSTIPIVMYCDANGTVSWKKVKAVNSPKGNEDIILAYYGPEKKAQANPGTLQNVRSRAIERIQKASVVTIIGVHIPPDKNDDPFLSNLLDSLSQQVKTNGCLVHYVSPSDDDLNRASNLGFRALNMKFSEYV